MRRLLIAAVVVALHAQPGAQSVQDRPLQADGVVRVLDDLERALASGSREDLRLVAPLLKPADEEKFARATRGKPTGAVVREAARRPFELAPGFEVLAEVLVSHGRDGRIMTWQLTLTPHGGSVDRFQLTAIEELAIVDGLLKLELDRTRQFALHHFAFRAPDFTLTMESGSAFVAESSSGVTALVLRGKGAVQFSPPDPAEQSQLRVFARKPSLSSRIDSAFIRLNAAEFAARIPDGALPPARVNPAELRRAQEIFDTYAPRTFNLDLGTLTPDRWSLEPAAGSTVVEFKTSSFGWLTYARAPTEPEDVTFFDRAHGRNISVYSSAERRLRHGLSYSEDDDATYDVQQYSLDLSFDPARLWVAGRGSMQIRIKAAAVNSVTIKLAPALTVSSVSSQAFPFGRLFAMRIVGQSSVIVTFPRGVSRGTDLTLDVLYSGRLESQGLDREALWPEGQVQTTPAQDLPEPMIQPEPRFMYSNRVAWYPQAQVTDYAPATMRLSVPSEYQIIASGTFKGSSVTQVEGGAKNLSRSSRTVDYVASQPIRYLSCVISRFVPIGRTRVDVGSGQMNLEVVSTPRTAGRNRQTVARAAAMLRYYASIVGEAPFPDFTLAALDDNLPGGHSPPFFAIIHQALATTPYSWTNDPVSFDGEYAHFFLAHEIAHQWWGQAVGWKNYHEQWLSEGLAQYFAALYAGQDKGEETLRSLVADMRRSVSDVLDQGPIALGYRLGHIQGNGRVFRAIVYNKSAVVLHMLRQLIGDDAFFAGLKKFYQDWRFQKAGTDDIRRAFESESGEKLERFFERWIRGATIPRIRLTSQVAADGASALIRVEQVGEVFDVPLTVGVQYADGTSEEVLVKVTQPVVEQRIPLKGPVRRLSARDELSLVQIVR
jgi:hypothetical protein